MTLGSLGGAIAELARDELARLGEEVRERHIDGAVKVAQEVFLRHVDIHPDYVYERVLPASDGSGILVNLNPVASTRADLVEAPSPDRRSGAVLEQGSFVPRSFFFTPRGRSSVRLPAQRFASRGSAFGVLPSQSIRGQADLVEAMAQAVAEYLEDRL